MQLKKHNKLKASSSNKSLKRSRVVRIESCKFKINFEKIKKGLIVIGLSLILNNVLSKKEEIPKVSVVIEKNDLSCYSDYSLGKVYICNLENYYKCKQQLGENDILIIDRRNGDDPDMCIYNSCTITDSNVMMEVLFILEEYENQNPSNWDRSISSMYNEWIVHNICYSFDYKKKSTRHVDLDNEDEEFYSSNIFKLFLGR